MVGMMVGPYINVPAGETVESLVRRGMTMGIKNSDKVSKTLGMNVSTYRAILKLISLKDSGFLNDNDLTIVNKAIETINEKRQIKNAMQMVNGIVDRHWMHHSSNGITIDGKNKDKKLRIRLDRTILLISEACSNNENMVLPRLTQQEKIEIIKTLKDSMTEIFGIIKKVRSTI